MEKEEFEKLFNKTLALIGWTEDERGIAVGRIKGRILCFFAEYAALLPGGMAEVGAWVGGSARLITEIVPYKILRVFDTFEGIPNVNRALESDSWEREFKDPEAYNIAKRILNGCNVEIYRGIFPETAAKLGSTEYCLVHADADVYQSTKDICEFFYHRLVVGGVIIFDDYGYKKASGCRKAVDEFFKDKIESPSILTTGQAVVIKSYQGAF